MPRIYLDHNATTPLHPEVWEAMRPFLEERFGNPSSIYEEGAEARYGVEKARLEVAALISANEEEIIFTGGGTEADNLAVVGVARALRDKGRHLITSGVEHPAVLRTCRYLEEREGYRLDVLPVDGRGLVNPDDLSAALSDDTILVSIMTANNETGVIQPIEELCRRTKARGVLFHTDAVQAGGKIPISVRQSCIDLLTLSAHKMYGPKGVGVLYRKAGAPLMPLVIGGSQERGLRSGTENVSGIVGFGRAAALAAEGLDSVGRRIERLRERFETALCARVPRCRMATADSPRVPNTALVVFDGVPGIELVAEIDGRGISASSGSACSSGVSKPSPVLSAMGVPEADALSSVRFSLGMGNTESEMDDAVEIVADCVEKMRAEGARHAG